MKKNIAEDVKKLVEKYGEKGAVDVLEQQAKELTTTVDALTKEIEQAYDKYDIASSAANCGTVVITWVGKKSFVSLLPEARKQSSVLQITLSLSSKSFLASRRCE